MSYIDPNLVVSPKDSWTLIKVLRNGEVPGNGDGDAAIAIGKWIADDGEGPKTVLAVRWNGYSGHATGVGSPQSRGLPTWFILPEWMYDAILDSDLIPEEHLSLVKALLG